MDYQVIRSSRKTIAIQIRPDGEVIIRCPRRMPLWQIRSFVQSKADWIAKHTPRSEDRVQPLTAEELQNLRERARYLVTQQVMRYAPLVGVSHGRIAIRAQRTRWGSCSGKGNLNFNCLLALAPPEVLRYVVVHELCHRKHMNHSAQFWAEVERVLPDYRASIQWLKEQGSGLMARLPE